jgi:hypothetical protein
MNDSVKPGRYFVSLPSKKVVAVQVVSPLEAAPTEKHTIPSREHLQSLGIAGGGSFSDGGGGGDG